MENNCWGGDSFDPLIDLYPVGAYDSDPIWCPGSGAGITKTAEELLSLVKCNFGMMILLHQKTHWNY